MLGPLSFGAAWTGRAQGATLLLAPAAAILALASCGGEDAPARSQPASQIAFVSFRDGNNEIYVMNADGSGPRNLANHPADDRSPAWSPHGATLAFERHEELETEAEGTALSVEIYVMNADGSGIARLTDDPAVDRNPCW